MKKLIFFVCCVLCVCAFAYMAYCTWQHIEARRYTTATLCSALGTLGWGVITFNVVTIQYKWARYLCK